ncbi:MAG: site-2 protease family protein [Candidatus Levybacteria bacterium]|nr:site-2 protease family protein [Candidatus Levybacteria bacterium]
MESLFSLENTLAIVILIFSAILHETAHGYVADRLGDPTARLMGRLTLDPRPHIDPFLTILLPLLLILTGSPVIFGGAKPVPVDPFNLKDGRKDMALVSLAGPLTNIVLAILAAVLIHLLYPGIPFVLAGASFLGLILTKIVILNLLLAMFNLLPIPPLDGSKIFALLLPEKEANVYLSIGSIGMLIILFLLMMPIGPFSLPGLIVDLLSFSLTLLGF